MAQTIHKEKFDLILTGVQSEDLGYSSTGPMLAERLGWNHATQVTSLCSLSGEELTARCERDGGNLEEVELRVPAVLCVLSGINQPRYATLKGIMAAQKKEIRQWRWDSAEFPDLVKGPVSGRLEIQGFFPPEKKKNTVWLEGTPEEVARGLVEALRADAKLS
jgi:electron transfer flavoprotein beta subunit